MKRLLQKYLLFVLIIGLLIELNVSGKSIKTDRKNGKTKKAKIERKHQQYLNGIWNRIGKRAKEVDAILDISKITFLNIFLI